MDKANFSLVFNRRRRLDKKGKAAIEIYCYHSGRIKYLNTGISVPPGQWDEKKGLVGRENPNYIKLNDFLKKRIAVLEDYELTTINEMGEFTFTDIERFSWNGGSPKKNFIDWLRQEIDTDATVTAGTRRYRFNMLDKLIQVVGNDLPASRVNYETVKTFNNHMAAEGLKIATIQKYHNQLKKFIGIAVHEGIVRNNPYKAFRIKKPAYDLRKCLWYPELDRIWELEYPDDSTIELVRLKFMLSCYVGLRISDNEQLCWSHFRDGKIFLKMQKTVRPVVIPVNILGERAGIILDKAKRLYRSPERVFKEVPHQIVSRCLKQISIDSKMPFPLHFHVSRHSFCTLVANKTGSVFKVMEYAGLYKIDTAMIYINLSKIYDQ